MMKSWAKSTGYSIISLSFFFLSTPTYAATDINKMLVRISESLGAIDTMLYGAAYMIGIIFFFKALYHLKVYGEARTMMASHASFKEPIIYLIVGSILVYFPTARDTLIQSTFGTNSVTAYSEWQGGSDTNTMRAIFMIIQTIGLISFIRGWVMISKAAGQGGGGQGGYGKGMVHVLGGILALNVVGTANLIADTLGISLF